MDCIEAWGDIYNIIKYNGEISHHFTILKFNIKQNDFIENKIIQKFGICSDMLRDVVDLL